VGARLQRVEGDSRADFVSEFAWSMGPIRESVELTIPAHLVAQATRDNSRSRYDDHGPDLLHYAMRPCVVTDHLARTLRDQAVRHGLPAWQPPLLLVQSIPWIGDFYSTGRADYWRYPIETLADGGGDCEDLAILAVALLRRLGEPAVFMGTDDHVGVGIARGPGGLTVQGVAYSYVDVSQSGAEPLRPHAHYRVLDR